MTAPATNERYKNHRLPREIISHGVWLSYRFPLSYRDVQELLCARGIIVSHEASCQWGRQFGQDYANQLRHWCPRPGDKWHLDEVVLAIHGQRHYLWRAVDQDDNVLDVTVPARLARRYAYEVRGGEACPRWGGEGGLGPHGWGRRVRQHRCCSRCQACVPRMTGRGCRPGRGAAVCWRRARGGGRSL
jgi:hypothetical protein